MSGCVGWDREVDRLVVDTGSLDSGRRLRACESRSDSPEEALAYIRSLTGNSVPEAKIRAFVENGRLMVRHVESLSGRRYALH